MSVTEALLKSELDLAWQNIFKRDTSTAMAHAKKASTIANDSPEVAHVLGVIASRDGRSDLALPLLQKALNGGVTERRLRDMAEALVLAKHPEAAIAPINDAIKQFGASAESLGLLAAIYVALERYDEASKTAQQAVALKPNALAWETTIGFCDLIRGQFKDGLKAFTFRPQTMAESGRCPALHLSQPGDLWLKNEQGPGDTLFFLCHASALVERGWRLHVQSHLRTQKILQDTGLFAEVSLGFNCPQDGFWINIGDLPLAASQLGLPALSKPLPLKAQDKLVGKVAKLLQKFGPPPYIAVTWRGGVQGSKVRNGVRMGDRYIDTLQLGEALKHIDASVISVQRVPDSKEAKAFEAGLGKKFLDLSRLNDNLPEMLALMELVDDYIAVPNTNHHLREALGKPTKIIVNRPYEDWRWAHEGNSPWYPYATCYRQALDGNLTSVFQQIKTDLLSTFSDAKNVEVQHISTDSDDLVEDNNAAQIMELLQAGWKAVGANDVPTGIKYAQQVMAISPDNASAFHLLGWAAMRDLKIDLAVSVLKRACELDTADGRITGDYIRALSANQQHNLAIEVATTALNNPATNNRSSIHYGRAACYLSSNKLKEAVEDYQSCITINPNRLDAQEYSGMARLKLGDAIQGFRELTARKVAQRDELLNDWCCPVLTAAHQGAMVLIKRDMGLGDELTYLRYLPWLTAAGIKVDYWAGKKLVPVLERMGYLNQVYPDSQKAPPGDDYDLSFIVNDLPVAAHRLGAPEIASPLPLTPRPDLVEKWKTWLHSLGPAPYIGINWKAGLGVQGAGNIFSKLAKAVDAEPFAKALAPIGATWISLQRNVLKHELDQFQQYLQAPLHDASSLTDDIEDLLALLSLLDENIGVSNTNMHLRASLGLGSRVMVQTPGGDWRWGTEGHQSVWFTESIVYRQANNGDWNTPLATLTQDLEGLYGAGSASATTSVETNATNNISHATVSTKRIIWLTAGAIKTIDGKQTSDLASARYRVIAPLQALKVLGWQSEIVNEEVSQVMGGWGSAVPLAGDVVIVSKVFTNHALKLIEDAKQRGAKVVVDFCDNLLSHPKRGPLQHALLKAADKVVASTDSMAHAIKELNCHVDAVISDPVETLHAEPHFSPQETLNILWFGHAVNIDTLRDFLPKLAEYSKYQPLTFNVVTILPNGRADLDKIIPDGLPFTYTPWSVEAVQIAIRNSDVVVIPALSSQFKLAKSPNRLLEPLWAGRMVIAGPLPAYLPFSDSAWVGDDIIEGLRYVIANPEETIHRIKVGQQHIAQHHVDEHIGQLWRNVIESDSNKSTSHMKCMVIISYYDERSIDDLSALIASIDNYEPGHPIEITIVVNQQAQGCIDVCSTKYKTNILYRQNQGMNIGAWDYAWHTFKDVDFFIFLQDECRVIRDGWAHDYIKALEAPKVGLVGESINQRWNQSWNDLLSSPASNSNKAEIKARAEFYLSFMQRNNIQAGRDAKHVRSLIWALRRSTLVAINGFPIGESYDECIASEIAVSKKVEFLGLEILQIDPQQPFSRVAHTEWSSQKKIQGFSFNTDFTYGQKFHIAHANYKVKPRCDLFELIDSHPKRICEIGCADGTNLTEVSKYLGYPIDKGNLFGVDIVADGSCENYQNFQFIHQTAEEFLEAYHDAPFDLIILSDVVEHLYNPWMFMKKLKKLVTPHGRVLISVPNIQNLQYINGTVSGSFNYANTGLFDVTHIRFFSVETLTQLLEVNGYRVVSQTFRPDFSLQKLRAHVDQQFSKSDHASITFGNVSIDATRSQIDRYFSQQILISCTPI